MGTSRVFPIHRQSFFWDHNPHTVVPLMKGRPSSAWDPPLLHFAAQPDATFFQGNAAALGRRPTA